MAYKQNAPIIVNAGGTGVTSNTSYAVLCGGTTSTGAIQSIAGVGTSGQVLTSNGAAALPTFQAAAGGAFLVSKTTLTSAQVKALSTTPIQVVATPGASKVIYVLSLAYKLIYGGTNAFTVAGANLTLRYVNNSGQGTLWGLAAVTGAGWLDQTASTTSLQAPTTANTNSVSTNFENQALFISNAGSAIAGNAAGDNQVEVQVMYCVLSF